MSLNTRNLEASAYAQDITGSVWILEVTGQIELPQTYKAVIVRPTIPADLNPVILALDIIPLGDVGATVMTWEKFGYQELSADRPEVAQVRLNFQGKEVALVDVNHIES